MLDKTFTAATAEQEIRQKWEAQNLFACDVHSKKPPFSIMIPPPNVTGNLHLGHALNNSIQDTLCRYKRMKGFDVLWQPGMDHAGIATQMVVEKMLAKQGIQRHDLGRENFIKKVWEWKSESGGKIVNQLHTLGCSCDWGRMRFTLDEGLSHAVRKVFVQMYKDGLIYKDKRLVNWDYRLQTAVSDLEVIQRETVGKMWYFKYPVEENPAEYIMVGTTRPETLFGDTAVAVSADDERYQHLIGKNVLIPIINKPIPVVADEHADPTKGTGAVKITPAHDFNDFEVGKRHHLPLINILTNEAKLNENVPPKYQGMPPLQARPLVLEEIKELGLYDHEEDNPMTIPYGERTNVIIEPWLTDQWFVDAKKLAVAAIKAVKDGDTKFMPKTWENTYFEWMNNIQPWCISRQLWWGHQVPVWYGEDGTIFCEETEELAAAAAEKHYGHTVQLTRDTDVLDTWFSSGLWAFSTLGWPEDTPELKRYFPTTALVTAFDIIFFWVARMMMMTMYVMKEVPFKTVYLHGLIRDEKGQKMSKSKGNGIDPLEMCEKYGADALRFSLISQAGHGRDVLASDERVKERRNFVTKIWNAARFCEMNGCTPVAGFTPKDVTLPVNRWIVTKLNEAAKQIATDIDAFAFNEASQTLYHFIWGTFCDWYLEAIKPIFYGDNEADKAETRAVAAFTLDEMLKILHPFMPFVSEEIWDKTATRDSMLMATAWPDLDAFADGPIAADVDWVMELITAIRSVRSEMNIPPATKIQLFVKDATARQQDIITKNKATICFLARVADLSLTSESQHGAVTQLYDGLTILIPLEGVIDVAAETARLNKELSTVDAFIARTQAQLSNTAFTDKAPAQIIEQKRQSLTDALLSRDKMTEVLARLNNH